MISNTIIAIFLGVVFIYVLYLLSKSKSYSLTHVVMAGGGKSQTIRTVKTFGFHSRIIAERFMQKTIKELTEDGCGNRYYSAWIQEDGGEKIVIRDVSHFLKIEKL